MEANVPGITKKWLLATQRCIDNFLMEVWFLGIFPYFPNTARSEFHLSPNWEKNNKKQFKTNKWKDHSNCKFQFWGVSKVSLEDWGALMFHMVILYIKINKMKIIIANTFFYFNPSSILELLKLSWYVINLQIICGSSVVNIMQNLGAENLFK